ncbi:helix-turn-helix domain-containing protein [Roseomonas rosulenta]|uniref:helix-turn-helix domain-containing protein n=1 Tax=Roseomonas rosulenta TaxID=2748667 RepID=UPI0018DF03A6|nr:helix-turn-helix transcriptional regulator [Roseomonas rosulenta]
MAGQGDERGSSTDSSAADPTDLVGLRSALPFRLERLGEACDGQGDDRAGQTPSGDGTTAVRPAKSSSNAEQRRALNAIDSHVGARIRLRRQLLGMSQTKLAGALGITFQQLQKYESGLNRVTAGRLYDLGRALDMSISSFFEDLPANAEASFVVAPRKGRSGDVGEPERAKLHQRETLNLVRAYYALEDSDIRQRILELVGSLGTTQ